MNSDSDIGKGARGGAVTMRDVAREAKVHVTTVSLALRNSPQLPPVTRERIQALAKRMGYRANPLVVAFVQRRREAHPSKFQGTLAFITRSEAGNEWRELRDNPYIIRMFKAGAEQAEVLGFKLEPFEIVDYGGGGRGRRRRGWSGRCMRAISGGCFFRRRCMLRRMGGSLI